MKTARANVLHTTGALQFGKVLMSESCHPLINTLTAPEATEATMPGTVSDLAMPGVLCRPLCSCSQASMNPVPEFMKRFTGLSWLVIGIRATTSRATPQTTVYPVATHWAGDEN